MPMIKLIAIAKKPSGKYKMTVPVGEDDSNEVMKVMVEIECNFGQPEPDPQEVKCLYIKTEGLDRVFEGELDFSSDAVGKQYQMTARMLNKKGKLVGSPSTQSVTVQKASTLVG